MRKFCKPLPRPRIATMPLPWKIECEVWGGITGHCVAFIEIAGKEAEFATYEEAKAECERCMAAITQGLIAKYTPVEVWHGNL